MTRTEIIENGWKLDIEEEMEQAAKCMTYEEWELYKDQQLKQTKEAMRDLKGMNPGIETMYEDAIIAVVGLKFLTLFRKYEMIESCGMIAGRKLYAI